MLVAIEWVKHQAVNSAMDLILFWVVVGQIDASQGRSYFDSDCPPRRLLCEENSSTHRTDQRAAVDDKMKCGAERNREGPLERTLDMISRRGL